MTIEMRKIGSVLDSRPAGREALLAVLPRLQNAQEIVIDFSGVEVLTPSFADEFVTPLLEDHRYTVRLTHTQENITVRRTLAFLSEGWQAKIALE